MRLHLTIIVLTGLCATSAGTAYSGAPSVPNGTFEEGGAAPAGWTPQTGAGQSAEWLSTDARQGTHALGATTSKAQSAWVSDAITVDAFRGYIAEGWVKVSKGEGWLSVTVTGDGGTALATYAAPHVRAKSGWTYVAVETRPAKTAPVAGAASLRIEFWVNGKAALDDVHLTPYSPRVMTNASFESPIDNKGRIPMWDEQKDDTLLPGKRGGTHRLSADTPYEGTSSLELTPSGGWYALGSINYPARLWSDRIRLDVMAKCSGGAQAQLLAVWSDDYAQHVVKVDPGPVAANTEWARISTPELAPPAGASGVRVVLAALGASGTVQFDAADVVTCPPVERSVKVVVNQVGYDRKGPKSAIVMTNFFPKDSPLGTLVLFDNEGRQRHAAPLAGQGRMYGEQSADWGWYFWRADFPRFTKDGTYTARTTLDGVIGESFAFGIGPDRIFRETAGLCVDFFFVQRCGFDVPGWHQPCHLDNAKLPDGTHRDLTGGWHSAGDYNKISYEYGDGGVMYALVNAFESEPDYFAPFDRDHRGLIDVLDEAWWGAQYLAKLQIPDTGGFYNHIQQGPDRRTWMNWVAPEKQTDNIPGTPDDPIVQPDGQGNSPLAISGWARLSALLTARGIENDYRARAFRAWEQATASGGEDSPLLLISAVDLYLTTKEERFLAFARKSVESLLGSGPAAEGPLKGGYADTGDIPAAALAHFTLELPKEALVPRIRERLAKHLEFFIAEPDNPLGLSKQKLGPDGFFFEPTSALGHNYELACRAWSALMLYRVLDDRRAWDYAIDQLDFILGRNPYNLCMFEGKGAFNPPRYHHRYNAIPGRERGAVPGAIPNGFVRDVGSYDRPGFDMSMTGRQYPSYRTSEPWLIHNVFYLLAVTALHEAQE